MELQRITDDSFEQVWDLMLGSFPAHEMRSQKAQKTISNHPNFCPDVIIENGQFAGIIFYWLYGDQCFVEHFATLPSLRGGGVGARAMQMLLARHPLVVLEIDPPVDDISRRRKAFYERLGFLANPYDYYHTGYAPDFVRHPLSVLSCPRILTPAELAVFEDFNFNTVCKL